MSTFKIKLSEPFSEQKVTSAIGNKTLTLGIKTYSDSEIEENKNFFDVELREKYNLPELYHKYTLSEKNPELWSMDLQKEFTLAANQLVKDQVAWLKEQVLFIKSFTFPIQDEEGKVTNYTVKDSRDASPLGSLWENSEECLAVLLDALLDDSNFKEPTLKAIQDGVFRADIKAAVEAKNSKK